MKHLLALVVLGAAVGAVAAVVAYHDVAAAFAGAVIGGVFIGFIAMVIDVTMLRGMK